MDRIMKKVFWCFAALTISVVAFMGFYIVVNGLPFFQHTSLWKFLTGTNWMPSGEIFGIFPMLVSSLYGTAGAMLVAIIVGICTAIVLVEILPSKLAKILSAAVDLLAGIPSVIYGFWGLMVVVPMINKFFGGKGAGSSLLAVIFILALMVLPTVIRMTEVSLRAVPNEFKEGALALGASKLQYIFKVQLKAAKSGTLAGIILATGRALGETMAVILVAGNTALLPTSITDPVRTLTANIAIEMGYASGIHQQALFATGMILFILIIAINVITHIINNYSERREGRGSKA
ncbi:phosphate ABC transporter permease subunit PstC [Niameybacter massiliensis]|uniref:Phosphate transport system permease protein n=1 Tax=Holtiella tumoricola TaxID=3018743 RepID=A0AA42DP08_9FIRM|nr:MULTISPECIES: phosphate ABC transporter permease subunit PstC [Lachnospirales]MDA3732073.1 phosphate ABC transporter permease subunit PstC [Holtiella tumoricola]